MNKPLMKTMSVELGQLAVSLIAQFQLKNPTDSQLDELSIPLYNQLEADGYSPVPGCFFVEAQGIYEFGIVPVCFTPDDESFAEQYGFWLNIYPSGVLEFYC